MNQEQPFRVFPYFDGVQNVYGDPLAIERRLTHALGASPNQFLQDTRSTDINIAMKAKDVLVKAVRHAFEMIPFDKPTGKGATEQDCQNALEEYKCYLLKKKQSTATSPNTLAPSGEVEKRLWTTSNFPTPTNPQSVSGPTSG